MKVKEEVIGKRYFFITYTHANGLGNVLITTRFNKMFSLEIVKKRVAEIHKHKVLAISFFNEMNEKEIENLTSPNP